MESSVDAIIVADGRTNIVLSNKAAEVIFGYTADEMLGQPLRLLLPDERDDVDPIGWTPPAASAETRVLGKTVELTGRRRDGTEFPVELSVSMWEEHGETFYGGIFRDISERKRADRELGEAQSKYRALVEGSQLGVYIIQDDRYVYVNPRMTEIFGYTEKEFLALPSVTRAVSKTDREVVAGQMDRRLRGETESSTYMFRTRHADGHRLQIEVHGGRAEVKGRPAIIGTMLDVTEREETQDKLRRAERQYRELFEEAPMMYVITRSERGTSVIEDCNNSFLTSLGYAREDVVGHEMAEFSMPSSPEPGEQLGQKPAPGGVSDQERQLRRKDGGVLQTLMRTVPLYEADGRIRGERAMYMDVSQRRGAEQEIYKLQAQLYQSQKVEAIGRLAGGVAHDFNNVLTAVLGYSQMLLEQIDEDKPMYADLKEIQAAGKRAASLTRQLLAFSRQQVLNLVVIDLNGVVREIDQMLRRLIGEDVIMTMQLPPEQCHIKADRTGLEQILVNLAVNARDAMPSGGNLTIETATVTFTKAHAEGGATVPPGRYVRLSVSDTGCGMTPDTKARLFEPFFTTKEKGKGTGLGLATVYGAVKQLGGFIFVRSELQQGTVFDILLPQCDDVVSHAAAEDQRGTEMGGGEVVLLVEDDPTVRKFSAAVLTRHGYRVLEADSAARALTLLDEREDPIHLLLTDVVMPGMNGSDLAEVVETRRPGTKLLFLSGYTGRKLAKNVMRRGGGLLQKPFSAETLLGRIRRVLDGDPPGDAEATAS